MCSDRRREAPLEPLVSVLLASYNHERFVEASVRSVMAQKGVAFELLVLDDGSSDASPEILAKLSREFGFKFLHRANKGLVKTLNELLGMARGKYFCTFSSDDVMPAGRLRLQAEFLEAHPEYVACYGQVREMLPDGSAGRRDPRYERALPEASFEELFLGKKALHGCADFIRTREFRELGGYDERFLAEDFPSHLALSSRYGSLAVVDIDCCTYRLHSTNVHYDSEKIYRGFLAALELYKEHPLYRSAVRRFKSAWFSELAYVNKREALRRLPELASFTPVFFKRFLKLFIPKRFLRF